MLDPFAMDVRKIVIGAASYSRKSSVPGNGRVFPVTLRQLHVPLSHDSINRAVKQGCISQLDDFTCINGKYKAVFIVKYRLHANGLYGPPCTRDAIHGQRPVIDLRRPVFPEPRFFLHERLH